MLLLHETPSFSGSRRPPRKLSRRLTLALLGVIAVFQFLTLRSENGWGDDWTLYVAHARNLAEGRPYSETGFVYNPEESIVAKYPPGFPLLLAPVYSLTGMNFTKLKVPGIVLFVAALGVLALLANAWDGRTAAMLVVAIVGFNPFFTEFKNGILSDVPFLFFFLLALFVSDRALQPERSRSLDVPLAAAVGLAWWAAYATRTVGVVLPVAFSVLAIFRREQRRALAVSMNGVGRARPALIAIAALCVLMTYRGQYHSLAVQPSIPGVDSPDARSLFAYVRASTPKCAVMLFKKPRALALYTGRQDAIYSTRVLYAQWTSVTRLGATHLIVVRSSTQDSLFLEGLERQRPGAVTELFANPRFAVYDLGVAPKPIRRQAAALPSCNEARPQKQPRLVGAI